MICALLYIIYDIIYDVGLYMYIYKVNKDNYYSKTSTSTFLLDGTSDLPRSAGHSQSKTNMTVVTTLTLLVHP